MSSLKDLIILLGSQVKCSVITGLPPSRIYSLTQETKIKTKAAVFLGKTLPSCCFVVMGGHNFYVRYDEEKIIDPPSFEFESMVKGQFLESEAMVISQIMRERGISPLRIFTEELSATTEEQAKILPIILERDAFKDLKQIGLLSTANHLKKYFSLFEKEIKGITPIVAETIIKT